MHSQRALLARPEAQGRVSLAAAPARSRVCTSTRPKQQQVLQPSKARLALETFNETGLCMLLKQQSSVEKAAAKIEQLASQHRRLKEHKAAHGLMSTTDFLDQQQDMQATKAERGSRSARACSVSSKGQRSHKTRSTKHSLPPFGLSEALPAADSHLLAGLTASLHNSSLDRNAQDTVDELLAACRVLYAQIGDAQQTVDRLAISPEPSEADVISSQAQQEQQPLAAVIQAEMFAVYQQPTDDAPQFIELLRLPEQATEYEQQVQSSMLLVHLPGAATQPGSGCDAISVEQLAWQDQQNSKLYSQMPEEEPVAEVAEEEVVEVAIEDAYIIANKNSIKVKVRIHMPTCPGQDVVLAGSHPSLGSWSLDGAVRLSWKDGHIWCASLDMPADCSFEYKAVMRSSDGYMWEHGANRRTSVQGSPTLKLQHSFRQ